jgi:hypothetical protein
MNADKRQRASVEKCMMLVLEDGIDLERFVDG